MDKSTSLPIDLNNNPPCNFADTQHEDLVQALHEVKSENKKLADKLAIFMQAHDCFLQKNSSQDEEQPITKKRKSCSLETCGDNKKLNCHNCYCEWSSGGLNEIKSNNVSKVHVRVDPSDMSLIVKDGYNWRKYGQKVTRDNPSPRAYYKCSFAPSCPVKKKVQRSVSDHSILVATYEGQHTHHSACSSEISVQLPGGSLRPIQSLPNGNIEKSESNNNGVIPKYLIEQMATSLTRDPSFTAALAAAITGRLLDEAVMEISNDTDSRNFSI